MESMLRLVDEAIAGFAAAGINCVPGDVPAEMAMGEAEDGWVMWRPVPSTVTLEEVAELEQSIGFKLPPQMLALLCHRHFMELQIGQAAFHSHPSDGWQAQFRLGLEGQPTQELARLGYFPFANYSDWGFWCFAIHERTPDGECPVYLFDHEQLDQPHFVAPNLAAALELEWAKMPA